MRELFQGLRGNFAMFVSIVLVTFVSLSFVSIAALLQIQVERVTAFWFERSQIAIYLCNDFEDSLQCPSGAVSESQLEVISGQLRSTGLSEFIKDVDFQSQQDAFDRLVNSGIEGIGAEFLDASRLNSAFWVTVEDPNYTSLIVDSIEPLPGVAAVADQQGYFDPILQLLNFATLAAGLIATVMLSSAAILTSSTIRLSALSRSREIGIMRLVGASRFQIQLPLILEGVLAALIGAMLALALNAFLLTSSLGDSLRDQIQVPDPIGLGALISIAPAVIVLASVIAVVSSYLSVSRHLKL